MAGAGDRNISKPAVYQLIVNIGVDVHQYSVSGEPLGAMTGDGVAMIEVPHLIGVERNGLAALHMHGKLTVLADVLDRADIAVGDAQLPVGCGELHSVPHGELPFQLTVRTDAVQA